MMDIEEMLDIIHWHLDQSFDKVIVEEGEGLEDFIVTVVKDGKTATHEFTFKPHKQQKTFDNVKFELFKNL